MEARVQLLMENPSIISGNLVGLGKQAQWEKPIENASINSSLHKALFRAMLLINDRSTLI